MDIILAVGVFLSFFVVLWVLSLAFRLVYKPPSDVPIRDSKRGTHHPSLNILKIWGKKLNLKY